MKTKHTARRCQESLLLQVVKPFPMQVWTVALYDPRTDPWSVWLLARGGLSNGPASRLSAGCYRTIARDLLAAGLFEPVGCREQVAIEPATVGDAVRIAHGPTIAHMRANRLGSFLSRTYALVEPGTESAWVNPDEQVGALLAA
ncbi:SsgA family sporulation/cell division regulator [Pseudonocardia sp. ICBG1142]|uniref:SsgA family sporulation/cell division regulator n=1 Tax=Pseudonocardia sp. ICBG1142 TaxID=2846760 RepID=UPI001CF68BCF|nr:SsgA family sporulation/cell division regulator [Pseudonocardia sp. ICBG1142]